MPLSAILVRQFKSPEWREIESRFAPLWEILEKLQDMFRDQDTQGALVVPTFDFRA